MNLWTGYEKRRMKGLDKTEADLLKDKKMLEASLKNFMAVEVQETLEDGTQINVPLIDKLVAKRIMYDLDHPRDIDLKMYSAVANESKQSVDLGGSIASDLFKGVAINDTNIGSKK